MPPWPGGPCPTCGDDMPANLVRCRKCRSLLNPDLEPDSVEVPVFQPLQEIDSVLDLVPVGCFLACPHCDTELKVAVKYIGQAVSCNHCSGNFQIDPEDVRTRPRGFFADCPACKQRLRMNRKYLGVKAACKFCGTKVRLSSPPSG